MFVVATKIDVAQNPERVESLRALALEEGLPFYEISSVTGKGIEALTRAMAHFIVSDMTTPSVSADMATPSVSADVATPSVSADVATPSVSAGTNQRTKELKNE